MVPGNTEEWESEQRKGRQPIKQVNNVGNGRANPAEQLQKPVWNESLRVVPNKV